MPETKETDIYNLSDGGQKADGKTLEFFIGNSVSGEPLAHCGTGGDRATSLLAIGHFMAAEFDNMVQTGDDSIEIVLESFWMTPEEIRNLPEI